MKIVRKRYVNPIRTVVVLTGRYWRTDSQRFSRRVVVINTRERFYAFLVNSSGIFLWNITHCSEKIRPRTSAKGFPCTPCYPCSFSSQEFLNKWNSWWKFRMSVCCSLVLIAVRLVLDIILLSLLINAVSLFSLALVFLVLIKQTGACC